MLNYNEENKYNTIRKLENGEITRKEASVELNISLRHVDRLRIKYREDGEKGFIHKNNGKIPANKYSKDIIDKLENLYLEKFYYFNFEHFYEKIVCGKFIISYDAMLKKFKEDDIISPLAHKKTIKEYKDKIKEIIKENDLETKEKTVELFKSRIIETEKAHARRSSNLYAFGQEIQMDACQKMWFGGISSFFI